MEIITTEHRGKIRTEPREIITTELSEPLDKIYRRRFLAYECEEKNKIWKVLCPNFFKKYVPEDSVVLDIGEGYCEFKFGSLCRTGCAALCVDPGEEEGLANCFLKCSVSNAACILPGSPCPPEEFF